MLPIIEELTYTNTSTLLSILEDTNIICLDSSAYNEALGRYSFIGVDPFQVIKLFNELVYLNNQIVHENIFTLLSKQVKKYHRPIDTRIDVPFQGGMMGYWAYDLLHQLEQVSKPKQRLIDIPDLILGFYDLVIAIDHKQKKSWIISQGFPEETVTKQTIRAKERCQWLKGKLTQRRKDQSHRDGSLKINNISSNFNRHSYINMIQKTIKHIYDGDIFQANLSQCFSAQLPKHVRPIDVYLKLGQINPAPFSAYLSFDEISIASASPERFLRLQNNRVETRPIKGTRPRHNDPRKDRLLAVELLTSAKDKAENTMIVDLMRNDLSKVCLPESVSVNQLCGLESFETVHHLVSCVTGELSREYNAVDLLKACFPGGSITGAPKVRAMEIIYSLEPHNRGIYCGSIGYIGFDGAMDTSIVIRTFTMFKNKLFFQAGGGIVSDSIPHEEYEESLVKAKALIQTLCDKESQYDFAD